MKASEYQSFTKYHYIGQFEGREKAPNWRGGIKKGVKGWLVFCPDHPYTNPKYPYLPAARLMVENALGKYLLKKQPIHHVDGDCYENKRGNLVLCEDNAYHKLLHLRMRALKAYGNSKARKCPYCKEWDTTDNPDFKIYSRKREINGNGQGYHRSCSNTYRRRRYHESN